MQSLKFQKFEKASLLQNQLRSIVGGGQTTWTSTSKSGQKSSGTDTTSGKSTTKFSDNTSSNRDGRVM